MCVVPPRSPRTLEKENLASHAPRDSCTGGRREVREETEGWGGREKRGTRCAEEKVAEEILLTVE